MSQRDLSAFGAAVRYHRTRLALSQEALAERSDLHRTYVSGIERGERNLGLVNIYRLARALKVPASELFATADRLARRPGDATR